MDPVTATGLIASALSIAQIVAKVAVSCRHLQKEFSGALEHVGSISTQTSAIDRAIQQICLMLEQRPQTIPSSFAADLSDSTSEVHSIVQKIQDHVQLIKMEAETSQSKAKWRHLRKSTKVAEWRSALREQMGVLTLLLNTAQFCSNEAKAKIVEEASSTSLKGGRESNGSGSVPITSGSSIGAIASEGDCARRLTGLDLSGPEQHNVMELTNPEWSYSIAFAHSPPTLEISASNSAEQTGLSSNEDQTRSTLATTISFVDRRQATGLELDKPRRLDKSSMISVVVEGIGTGSTELVIHELPDHYDETHKAILHTRDLVLLGAGVDPGSYCGVIRVSTNIQTSGKFDGHRFPLTPGFLEYAVNKLRDGYYDGFGILARFSSPDLSNSGPTNLIRTALSNGDQLYHFDLPVQASLPFTETSASGDRVNGGFSSVFKVAVEPAHLNILGIRKDNNSAATPPSKSFAVKRLHHQVRRAAFEREVEMLNKFSNPGHAHIVKLLATYHWRGHYRLLFPWAEGHLQDFWKSHPSPVGNQQLDRSTFLWILEQCAGLADGLEHIHSHVNSQANTSPFGTRHGSMSCHGRHGDIKPANILWFGEYDGCQRRDVLKISDFGLAEFKSSTIDRTGHETRGGTDTYGAPELRHHSPGHRLSSAYDIWSFGCVLMEFSCWMIGGRKEVEAFKRSRYDHTSHGTFFEVKNGEIAISPPVLRQFKTLRHRISVMDPPVPKALGQFVDIIESCFEIDEWKRPSAAMLVSKMRAANAILSADQTPSGQGGNDPSIEEIG